eukprot:scaffold10764_cov159-Ochromonas_danica.AAC.27
MGCGKTLQAIALLQHYRNLWPALVLCPVSLLHQWRQEILRYTSRDLVGEEELVICRRSQDLIGGGKYLNKILIVPYSIIDKLLQERKIHKESFGVVVADESHSIKSISAKRTSSVVPLLQNATVSLCLTGTPAANRPVELFSQLHGLLPRLFSSYESFVKRYCDAKPIERYSPGTGGGSGARLIWDVKGSSNASELKLLLSSVVMIRRLKEEVLEEVLPQKCREVIYLDVDNDHLQAVRLLQRRSQEEVNTALREQLLMRAYQLTGKAKLGPICKQVARFVSLLKQDNLSRNGFEQRIKKVKLEVVDLVEDPKLLEKNAEHGGHEEERSIRGEGDEEGLVDTDEEEEFIGDVCGDQFYPQGKVEEAVRFLGKQGEVNSYSEEGEIPSTSRSVGRKRKEEGNEHTSSLAIQMKMLIFAHHQVVMDGIEDVLRAENVDYVRVDGRSTSLQRNKAIERFTSHANTTVALLSLSACGTGLNLTCASLALMAEVYWTPAALLQAEDRIHRLGQAAEQVRIVYLLARNTADEIVWEMVQKKASILADTVGGGRGGTTATIINASSGRVQRSMDSYLMGDSSLTSQQIPDSARPPQPQSVCVNDLTLVSHASREVSGAAEVGIELGGGTGTSERKRSIPAVNNKNIYLKYSPSSPLPSLGDKRASSISVNVSSISTGANGKYAQANDHNQKFCPPPSGNKQLPSLLEPRPQLQSAGHALTAEQLARIEANRLQALERLRARQSSSDGNCGRVTSLDTPICSIHHARSYHPPGR